MKCLVKEVTGKKIDMFLFDLSSPFKITQNDYYMSIILPPRGFEYSIHRNSDSVIIDTENDSTEIVKSKFKSETEYINEIIKTIHEMVKTMLIKGGK